MGDTCQFNYLYHLLIVLSQQKNVQFQAIWQWNAQKLQTSYTAATMDALSNSVRRVQQNQIKGQQRKAKSDKNKWQCWKIIVFCSCCCFYLSTRMAVFSFLLLPPMPMMLMRWWVECNKKGLKTFLLLTVVKTNEVRPTWWHSHAYVCI